MLDDLLSSMETIRKQPVWQPIPDEVRARFRGAFAANPTSLEDVHQEFMTSILPYTARNAHPGFMGWVQGGGTPVGMLAEMLAAGLNANVGGRDQIPLDVERQVKDWVRTLFGFPPEASGLFVSGTSMANFLAIIVARDTHLGFDVRRQGVEEGKKRLTAYASKAVHGSIGRALDFAGIGSDALRLVAVDSRQRIDLDALEKAIAEDRSAGFTPFLVIGNAGTVDTGAIDDLSGIAELCAREQLWFHVDGAYGALAILSPAIAPRLKGIEKADSLAFDFHKWAQVPYDAGFILVRDGMRHQRAFSSSCSYLQRGERGMSAGSPWPCDLGVDLSRGFRALKTWATLKVYGTKAIGEVIDRTCELARYLERRILESPELELMVGVELNIVCFRYHFIPLPEEASEQLDERSDRLNREIVVELQEAGAVAPSTTLIGGRLSIRAAIVNHRTRRAEMDTLIEATLAAGRRRQCAGHPTKSSNHPMQPSIEREARLKILDTQLDAPTAGREDFEVALRIKRATLLAEMGRNLEARTDYLTVFGMDPSNLANLLGLGKLFVADGQCKAAQMVYAEAVRYHPKDLACLVNLGSALLAVDDPEGARAQYEAALLIDPNLPQAHSGMYYALKRLDEPETAKMHQRKGFSQNNLFSSPYRGDSPPISVLLLVSSTGGNVPIEKLLDDRVFKTYIVVADFYDAKTPLPSHQLVINGIGDPDAAEEALLAAEALLTHTSAPTLNAPAAVRATGRCNNAARLKDIPGLVTPAITLIPAMVLAGKNGPVVLAERGLAFPLLLRAPGFHQGEHFVRIESPASLTTAVIEFPGYQRPETELLAIEFLDATGPDGLTRKYRVMMVGGRLYPLHLAISRNWKIHYFSADMQDNLEHRAEESRFLVDMPNVLGSKAMAALERLVATLGLDYGGIDFGLNREGDVLLFEANATMVVEQPAADERWNYRRTAVQQIHTAVRYLLLSRTGAVQHSVTELHASNVSSEPFGPADKRFAHTESLKWSEEHRYSDVREIRQSELVSS
jgi:aromatic-L-amino-acid decarboxylase